ncbi:aldo/keto reductase [Microbacterium sp. NPDC087591]|uniref:aldo/keto reductase n=1 Tax=Microbacterium sp. NPDC087591 TaxID=3364192 RepID=UPI0037F6AFE7
MTAQLHTPQIILGTMDHGTRVDESTAFRLLDRFVEAGGHWLDTANCYSFWSDPTGLGGASERTLGAWMRANPGARSTIGLATKVRQDPLVAHSWPESAEGLSADAIRAGLDGSLERLGVDHVDLLWAHAEDRSVDLAETVAGFGEAVAQGRAIRIGAANHASWRVQQARELARRQGVAEWSALQLRHSLVQPRPGTTVPEAGHKLLQPDDLDFARSEGLALWCYTPLLMGGYTRADRPFSDGYAHPGTERVLRVLDEVAREVGATPNQVVLAWLMSQGISPLVGASRVEQIDEAMGAREVTLSAHQLRRFAEAR